MNDQGNRGMPYGHWSEGGFHAWSQMAGTPHNPERRVSRRTWFDSLHGEAFTLIECARALVGHEMFDIQPISVSGQLPGDGIK